MVATVPRSLSAALRRWFDLPLFLVLVPFFGCGSPAGDSSPADAGEPGVVVRVVPAERRVIARTVDALGRCEAVPEKLALLTPLIEGRVSATLVQQGAQVTAGQPVVALDPTLAKVDLAEKQAARDTLAASLELLQSLPREKEQQASRLAIQQAKIAVAKAEALVERLRPLRLREEISEQQMFEAEQALAQARLEQQSAEAQFDVLMQPPRPQAVAEAEDKIQVAEQAVAAARARLDLLTIRAPIDGILDRLSCRLGQTVSTGADIGTVVDSRQVLIIAWLPVASGRQVRVGQMAQVKSNSQVSTPYPTAAEPDDMALAGQVVFTGRIVDPQTGNIPIHLLLENTEGRLVIGQTVETTIVVQQSSPTVAVPRAAIHDEGEGPALTVVRDGKTVVLHPELGVAQAGWIAVAGGDLAVGEPVIVEGAYNLPEGTPVQTESNDK